MTIPRPPTQIERDEICELLLEIQDVAGQLEGNVQMYTSKFKIPYIRAAAESALKQLQAMNKHVEDESERL